MEHSPNLMLSLGKTFLIRESVKTVQPEQVLIKKKGSQGRWLYILMVFCNAVTGHNVWPRNLGKEI